MPKTETLTDLDFTGKENLLTVIFSSAALGQDGDIIVNNTSRDILVNAWGTIYQVPKGESVGGLDTKSSGVFLYQKGSLI